MQLFWFLSLFPRFLSAESFHLTEEIFNNIISMKERTPIFLELWDPWCHNCEAFKNDWKELTSAKVFEKKIIFGDINCVEETKFCQKISPGKEYPRFVWFDSGNATPRRYSSAYSLNVLVPWIQRQLNGGGIDVINESINFEKIKHISIQIPLFRFQLYEKDELSLQIAKAAFVAVKHFQIKIVISFEKNPMKPTISHYTADNRVISLREDFTANNIINFIRIHAVRFFIPYNDMIGQFSSVERIPVLVFAFPSNDTKLRHKALEIAKLVDYNISTSQVSCSYDRKFCNYHGINDEKGALVIINKSKELFWTNENFEQEIKTIGKWVNNVMNGNILGSGPGIVTGPLNSILTMFYEFRGIGGWRYYAFFLPIAALFLFLTSLVFYCMPIPKEKKEKPKKDKED